MARFAQVSLLDLISVQAFPAGMVYRGV